MFTARYELHLQIYCELLWNFKKSVSWRRRLIPGRSPGKPGFDLRFFDGQSGTGTDFTQSPSVFFPLFHQYSIRLFIYMVLLQVTQTGEAWELSKKHCSFGIRGGLDRNVRSCY